MTDRTSAPAHFKPRLNRLLRVLGLDVAYQHGAGSSLCYRDDNDDEVRVLDMAGGFGSLLLGHNHPALVARAVELLNSGRPVHVQGSRREYAERLAAELSRRAGGDFCVLFANSGTEAVEAAVKHAMLETGSRRFIALERSFHGQTLGALQLTGSERYRRAFDLRALEVVRVPPNDLAALEQAFARADDLAGCIFEPILGEGGILPLSREFSQRAAAMCAARAVPLIADECQTGLGRTGTFLACEQLGIRPDYVVLSKALGGGLAKIAALLISRRRYVDEFDLLQTSTYADDDHSCAVALDVLSLLDGATIDACAAKGARFIARLRALAGEFPDVIADVRGAGLMIGVELRPLVGSLSVVLRLLSARDDLGYVVASYLLAAHRIRVAPTLGSASTLRLEPAVVTSDTDLDRVVDALRDVCGRIRGGEVVALTGSIRETDRVAASVRPARAKSVAVFALRSSDLAGDANDPKVGGRVAWLFHLVDDDDLATLDPRFAQTSALEREAFLRRFAALSSPIVMSAVNLRSKAGANARLFPILLPFTSRWAKRALDARRLALPRALVQEGVDVAHALGCGVVSLGQYTSIVSGHGTRLTSHGMTITTGNSFAVVLADRAIGRAHARCGADPRDLTLAIVGAAGNVGRACATIIGQRYRRVLLVGSGRRGSRRRLQRLAAEVPGAVVADRTALPHADVVIAAVNDVETPLGPGDFARSAIVCDLSMPAAVQRTTPLLRPDVLFVDGVAAQLPSAEDLLIEGFPLPPGQAYGCLAEAVLLGWSDVRESSFTGALTPELVARVAAMADRHGLDLIEPGDPVCRPAAVRSHGT